jgi:hypothetical protein
MDDGSVYTLAEQDDGSWAGWYWCPGMSSGDVDDEGRGYETFEEAVLDVALFDSEYMSDYRDRVWAGISTWASCLEDWEWHCKQQATAPVCDACGRAVDMFAYVENPTCDKCLQ